MTIAATLASSASSAVMAATDSMEVGKGATNYINSNGELMLYGVIGDWWEGNDALSVVSQLEYVNPSGDLHVRIHSDGGNYLEGLAIYNALKLSDRRIVVTIDGMALSAATVIALAGDEIRMPRNAFQFFHLAGTPGTSGNSEDLRAAAETLELFSKQAASIYAEHSNLSEDEALVMMQSDTWLNAEQCLERGFIHKILDPVEAVARHMDFGDRAIPQGVHALMQLPIIAAPAAQTEEPPEDIPVKTAQMSAGQPSATPSQTPAPAAPVVDPAANAAMMAEGIALERTRQAELRSLATLHNVDSVVMQAWIDDETSIEDARTATLKLNEKNDINNMPSGRGAIVTNDGRAAMSADMSAAILHRCAPGENSLTGTNEFAHMSMIDMSRQALMHMGVSTTGMSPQQIASAVLHSTSDLPNIFADVANNEMARGYAQRQRTFTQFATRRNMRNFKTENITRMSDAPMLMDKQENGEYKLGHLKDSKETIALGSKGRVIRISREMLVNDDMDALSRLPMMMGAQGALNEIRMVYQLIASNPTMKETGKAMFSADHKNLLTGSTSLDVDVLGLLRKLLRQQRSFAAPGEVGYRLNTPLSTLLVPAALETAAQKLVTSITPTKSGDVNPFQNLSVIAEAELDDYSETAFYGLGDPSLVEGIVYGYLEGEEGVYIDSQIDFKSDALEMKVRHDFAVAAGDFRGSVKHSGE